MLFHFAAVGVFLAISVVFIFGTLVAGRFIRPNNPSQDKNATYECGEPTIGPAWVRFNIRFYTVALVYLVFDVEAVFLFPVALILKELKANGAGVLALSEILFFVLVLAVGLVYAWRYGNLDWIRAVSLAPEPAAVRESSTERDLATDVSA